MQAAIDIVAAADAWPGLLRQDNLGRDARERLGRIEGTIAELMPNWSLAPAVEALQALRDIRLATAATITIEAGDLGRFETARHLMGELGLVPGERPTGNTVRRLGITRAGNGRLRRALVESAWTYRHPPRTGKLKHSVLEQLPTAVQDIAWMAQTKLCARYRALASRGRQLTLQLPRWPATSPA